MGVATHDINDSLPIVLRSHGEGGLEAGRGLPQDQEGLVWPLRLAIFLGRQEDLQRVGAAEGDRLGRGRSLAKPRNGDLSATDYTPSVNGIRQIMAGQDPTARASW